MSISRLERPAWPASRPHPGGEGPVLDFEQIRRILAHRFPMLMVDRVTAFEAGKSIDVIKQVSGNDIFFVGHFPRQAVWPGALITESMAQASALLFVLSRPPEDFDRKKRMLKVLHKMSVTFVHPVYPGDSLAVRIDVIKMIEHALVTKGAATVDGRVVARGEIILGEIAGRHGG